MFTEKMATTIAAGFGQLKSNLEISGLQASTVSIRQNGVRNAIEDGFRVLNSFVSGSYARSTMISPLNQSDVDIFFVLDAKYHSQYSPAQLLDRVRKVLLKTYTRTPRISRNGQAVTITFADFKVDAVPGFYRRGGGFLIPNSITGNWLSTDPKLHQTELTAANILHGGDLVPIIKMIKGWNRCINNAFGGFYLELLVKNVLTNVKISDYSSGVRFVFDKGRQAIRYKILDPARYSEAQIAGLRNATTVDAAVGRFNTALNRALRAEQFARQGRIGSAFLEWKKVFPSYFPTYG